VQRSRIDADDLSTRAASHRRAPGGVRATNAGAHRRATMRDVAQLARVSLSTVSRVVNGSPVDATLAARVQDAVAILGYRQNLVASTLRRSSGVSSIAGLVFEDVANPFFASIHRGLEEVLRTRDILTFAGSSDENPDRERQLAEAFAARGADGLVISPAGGEQSYLARDRDAGMFLVFIDRPPRHIDGDFVVSDNFDGARRGCEHLIAHGHRRIGFLGDRKEIYTATERLRGYIAALNRHGIPEDPDLIRHDLFRPGDARAATRELLEQPEPPTALFTSQNLISIEAVTELHELGLHHRVAMVGFDDIPLANVLDPGVTVVAQDAFAIGIRAGELLIARLDGDEDPPKDAILPVALIERGSGEIPPPQWSLS
jgi:LacI family transcriptional regulator